MSQGFTHYPSSVTSVNGLVGALTLVAGSNITITPSGQNLIIAASGGGGSGFDTIGTFDTGVASTDGLNASGTTLFAQSADPTHPGMVNIGTQSFAGNKTFTGTIAASNLSGTNTGDVTIGTANGLSLSGQALSLQTADASHTGALTSTDWSTFNGKQAALTIGNLTDVGTDGITITGGTGAVIGSGTSIAQHVADTTHNGYLSSTDWNTFNGKQAAGNYITGLTGDVTASGPGSAASTLATVNSNVGTFASVTVNGKGLVTAAAALSGDATTSGSVLTLASVATAGTTGSSTSIPAITINAKGLVTSVTGNAVIAPAGTLTGTTLASNVVTSSLTTVGTIGTGVWQGTAVDLAHGGTNANNSATAGNLVTCTSTAISVVAPSSVYVDTGNGHGSTNTKVRRFTNIRLNTGSDITYADSATNGASFTINTAGVYFCKYEDQRSTVGSEVGISVNGSALTTAIDATTYAQGRRACVLIPIAAGLPSCSATLVLAVNDVVRPQDDGNNNDTSANSNFLITRVA